VFIKKEENDKANAHDRFDRFLKVEHMDAQSLHLKRWASQEKGDEINPTFYKIFRKGQILFPTRNPHLKRTALASFDGICGEKTLTLEPNKKLVIPEFIPFLFHSESFYEHTTSAIVGSTNPHVRWRDVANYEFLLPPKDQQVQLAELLWAMDEVIEREKEVEQKFQHTLFSSLKGIFQKTNVRKRFIDLCSNQPKYGANSPAIDYDNITRYLRITDIGEFGELNDEKVSAEKHEDKYLLKYGDFLLARSADPGRSYFYKDQDGRCTHAGYLIKFPLDLTKILPEYLYYFTQTREFKIWINQTTRTGTLSNINSKEFSNLMIPFTSISNQTRFITEISNLYKMYREINEKIGASKALQKSLINKIF
jgi:restriction endonuclease S subunit